MYVSRCIYGGGKRQEDRRLGKNRSRLEWGRGEEGGQEWDGASGSVAN